jgi:glutathione S-transferase
MIIIHHLGISQSDRIVWLMEELGLPYELKWYDRGPDFLAPPEYRALHPAGTAPIIEDGDLLMTESTAIVEYISQRHGKGRLSVPVASPDYPHYLYWMQFNNNLQAALFIKRSFQAADPEAAQKNPVFVTMSRRAAEPKDYTQPWSIAWGNPHIWAGPNSVARISCRLSI